MSESTLSEPTCDFCEKDGLPILPARLAIAPKNANAPKAEGAMLAGDAANIPLGEHAHYTTRILRSGYLYMYDEARKYWSAWFITDGAYFIPFEVRQSVSPALLAGREPCSRGGHREIASCITISSPKLATKVWLAFSDVQWTPEVLDRHSDATYRDRHMRKLDVPELLGNLPEGKPLARIAKVDTTVAEYAFGVDADAFEFSLVDWQERKTHGSALVFVAEQMKPGKGTVVVLDDPVGVAMDLTSKMTHDLARFTGDATRRHELATFEAISAIEQGVKAQARAREDQFAEELLSAHLSQPDFAMLFESYREDKVARAEERFTVTEADAAKVAQRAWADYTEKFDVEAMHAWKHVFDAQLHAFDRGHIVPIAMAHAAWMQSNSIAAAFECNYDDTDAQSGLAYATTLGLCIGGSQDKAACFDLYVKWLSGDASDKKNLVLRGLVLNQSAIAQQIHEATQAGVGWESLGFDRIADAFTRSTQSALGNDPDRVGRALVVPLLGPISKLLTKATDGKVRGFMVALGMYTQQPFAVVEVTGGKTAFRTMLIRQMSHLSGQVAPKHKLQRAVSAELRRLEVAGVPLEGTDKKRFVLLVDPEALGDIPANAASGQRVAAMAKAIRTPAQVEALHLENWRQTVRKSARGSVPYVGGLITAVLQYEMMQSLIEDDVKAMAHQKNETSARMVAGVMAVGGTIAELTGQGIEKMAVRIPRFARGTAQTIGKWAGRIGRGLGIGGALIMAWWDGESAFENYRGGNTGLAIAYGSSAVLGLAATGALLLGWTGVGLILIGLLIGVTIVIEHFKDNDVQEWLERCVWGKGDAPKYATADDAMRELELATGG